MRYTKRMETTASTPARPSQQRWVFTCEHCNSFKVSDLIVRPDGSVARFTLREPSAFGGEYETPTTFEAERRCVCGAKAKAEPINGHYSTQHVCDPRCTGARGNCCDCSCGGANHGAMWAMRPTWFTVFVADSQVPRKREEIVEATPETVARSMEEKAARQRAKVEAKAQRARLAVADTLAAYTTDAPDVVSFLQGLAEIEDDAFLLDMVAALERWGHLTPRQETVTRRIMERRQARAQERAERAERLASAPALKGGRQKLTGTIARVSFKRSDRGRTHNPECMCSKASYCENRGEWKMTVELPDGNRVWFSVPKALNGQGSFHYGDEPDALWWTRYIESNEQARAREGLTVSFAVEVTVSDDDPHFGYGHRPTGMVVVGTPGPLAVKVPA